MATVAVRMVPSTTRTSSRRKRVRSRGDDSEEGGSSAVAAHLQAPSQRARPLSLTEHVDKMAQGCQRYVEKIQALVNAGLLERHKLVEHVRIVSGFRDAMGVDVTHGMLELFHFLLPQLPITHEDEQHQRQTQQELGRGARRAAAAADSSLPYQVDEMACYLKSFGGRGVERVECSEAFRQLFMSTEEVLATVEKNNVTSVSVLACVLSTEAFLQLFEALAVVFFQKGGPTEVEIEHMECRTRLGLQLACRGLVSFRLHANGESTLMLVLTVKQQQQDELAPPSRQHPGVPTQSPKLGLQEEEEEEEPSTRRSHTSARLAALAARKQEQERAQAQQQYPDDSRPPAKRAPVSSRRRSPAPVAWSQEGPAVPQSMVERLLAKSPALATAVGGCWCRDEATGAVIWCGAGEEAQGGCLPLSAAGARRLAHSSAFAQQLQELERRERESVVVATAPAVVAVAAEAPKQQQQQQDEEEHSIAPFAFEEQEQRGEPKSASFFPLEVAPAADMALTRADSDASSSTASASSAGSSSAAQEEGDDDAVWAWADSLWEGGLNGVGTATEGTGDDMCALVTSPEVWALLEQPPLFDSMGLL